MSLRYIKEIAASPIEVMRNLYNYRHILFQMVVREIKGRFAGSVGGLLWHFIHPILMLVTFLFVFVYIFKLRIGAGAGAGTSAIYLMSGLFPWIIMAEGLARGTSSLIESANLIQKTYFPTEILTTKNVIAPFLSYGIAIVLLTLYRIVMNGHFEIVFFLLFMLTIQFFFTLGISFLCATASVFFRDVMQLVHIIISFWIYVTPILYPTSMLPEWAQQVMYVNPLYPFVSTYQSLFVYGNIGQPHMMVLACSWATGAFFFGAFIFNKLKNEFADWV